MANLPVPACKARIEIRVVNSRFIATVAPAFTVDEAKAFINQIRVEFPDASHNVPAFLIGHGSSVTAHCSDDGEPSGTAGRPVLAVLKGSGLGDVVVVVTRYFGGTKLGTGGLVRAYGDAVRQVLDQLPRAVKVATQTCMVVVPYSLYEQATRLVEEYKGVVVDTDFAADVTLSVRFTLEQVEPFQNALLEASSGTVQVEVIQTDESTIMPL